MGALALLLAWAPVATANAITCAVWCEMNGGLSTHHASMHGEHDHGGVTQGATGKTVNAPDCGSPDLLLVTAVAPDALAIPFMSVTMIEPPVASLHSFISSLSQANSPPPRF